MEKLPLSLFSLALFRAASLVLSCGTSSPTSLCGAIPQSGGANSSALQSITISPAMADAQNCPDHEVQFTATGHYSAAPFTVTPQSATWGACFQNAPTTQVSVTNAGLAQCLSGADGTYTVFADNPTNCEAVGNCGEGCFITSSAQLTCP